MDKKDYLHFYIGQDVDVLRKYPNGDSQVLKLILDAYTYMNIVDGSFKDSEVKLILRPLSDMSEEDFKEFAAKQIKEGEILKFCSEKSHWYCAGILPSNYEDYEGWADDEYIYDQDEADPNNVLACSKSHYELAYGTSDEMKYFVGIKLQAKWIAYLLSKGFDLFGLIEKGLAISKTLKIK